MKHIGLSNFLICPHCSAVLEFKDSIYEKYFNPEDINCFSCQKKLNLWDNFVDMLDGPLLSFGFHYSLLGCIQKFTEIQLKRDETYTLDLSNEIGEGSLLYINYTPEGQGVFPIQLHSNTPMPHVMENIKYIYGKPQNEGENEVKVTISYVYAPEGIMNDLANMLLLDAFKFYYEGNYRYMIISAHSTVEILQYKFFEKILTENGIGKEKIENFLTHAATYSYRLKTLMPFVCEIMDFPKLNNQIYEGLENLRKNRNELIHNGETDISDMKKLKKELISAFFAFKYFKIIHKIK